MTARRKSRIFVLYVGLIINPYGDRMDLDFIIMNCLAFVLGYIVANIFD